MYSFFQEVSENIAVLSCPEVLRIVSVKLYPVLISLSSFIPFIFFLFSLPFHKLHNYLWSSFQGLSQTDWLLLCYTHSTSAICQYDTFVTRTHSVILAVAAIRWTVWYWRTKYLQFFAALYFSPFDSLQKIFQINFVGIHWEINGKWISSMS